MRFGHKSFYRFGIRSCLAISHKQILETPFSMTSSCILGKRIIGDFSSEQLLHLFRFPVLTYVAETPGESQSISEANNSGLEHNSARLDKWLEILVVEDLTPKLNDDLSFSKSSEEERPVRSSRSNGLYKALKRFNTEIIRNGLEILA